MIEALKEYGALAGAVFILLLLAVFGVAVWQASGSVDWSWFSKPLRDATIGDVVIVLALYLIIRK
jgi:hypothetical protein